MKRIWTPSWVLFSGGWCFLMMGASFAIFDVLGWRRLSFPLAVIGANSIAAYVMAHTIEGFLVGSVRTHLGPDVFKILGAENAPLVEGTALLSMYWLILLWMYKRQIFLRV